MPVIINDLEVILETPATPAGAEATQPAAAAAPVQPATLRRIERYLAERARRTRAQ